MNIKTGELVKNDACFYTSESWQLRKEREGEREREKRGEKPSSKSRVLEMRGQKSVLHEFSCVEASLCDPIE